MVMVVSVVTPNTIVTPATVQVVPLAAAYIRIGIKGSHGPKMKIVNNTHGVNVGCRAFWCVTAASLKAATVRERFWPVAGAPGSDRPLHCSRGSDSSVTDAS